MPKPGIRTTEGRLEEELARLRAASQFRSLGPMEGINLCSNDYLGLSDDARLRDAVAAALAAGSALASTGSRLLSGNAAVWEQLESDFARFIGSESALYFTSGYAANLGLLSSVLRPEDVVFSDQSNHASIVDGIRLSRARKVVFPHLDLNFLEKALRSSSSGEGERFVVVESVFSMDGDRAPLLELLALAERYGAGLIVDEAHAVGVLGPQGRGLLAETDILRRVFAGVYTCGKALASAGAFVCCPESLKQYLVNRARTFIFSTALPPYLAAQIHKAVELAIDAGPQRRRLECLADFLRECLRGAGLDPARSNSQIIPVILGSNDIALHFADELCRAGFAVRPIRPPTVPQGSARLRVSLRADLSEETLAAFVSTLAGTRERLEAAPTYGQ